MYEVTCSSCGRVRYIEHASDMNMSACYGDGGCGSLKFGLQKYHWIDKQDYLAKFPEGAPT